MTRNLLAIFFDFGDTLADEDSEIKDATATTLRAELIPGADQLLRELRNRGYKLALVADGRPGTYSNVLTQHGLYDYFDAFAISELVGVEKPDARMFLKALDNLDIDPQDYRRTVMVGNRLDRDVKGANQMGMISVWQDWGPRYSKTPANPSEEPHYTIKMPLELLPVIDTIEQNLRNN